MPKKSKLAAKSKTAAKAKPKTAAKSKNAAKLKSASKAKKATSTKKLSPKKLIKKVTAARPAKKKVLAIPNGYHTVTPYLIVDAAANAIEFYKKAFGAKLATKIERPDGKISHAELKIGSSRIMLADECREYNALSPKAHNGSPVSFHVYVKNVDKVVDRAVAAGAKLTRPVENMFYGDRCGCLEDQYGHQWHISTHIEDVSTRELKKRSAQVFGQNN